MRTLDMHSIKGNLLY